MTVHGSNRSRKEQFDPRQCVTARELRSLGLEVPMSIPNSAWIPRSAVKFGTPKTEEGEIHTATVPMSIEEPFRWAGEA